MFFTVVDVRGVFVSVDIELVGPVTDTVLVTLVVSVGVISMVVVVVEVVVLKVEVVGLVLPFVIDVLVVDVEEFAMV